MDRDRTHAMFTSLPSNRTEQDANAFVLQTLGSLWLLGVAVNWPNFSHAQKRRRIPLPSYPFERQRYWVAPSARVKEPLSPAVKSESFTEQKPEAPMPEQAVP